MFAQHMLRELWGGPYTEDERHEATEDGEQDVAALVAEAAAGFEEDEGGHEERADRIQQRPVGRRQQAAGSGLALALCMGQPLRGLQDLTHIRASPPAFQPQALLVSLSWSLKTSSC